MKKYKPIACYDLAEDILSLFPCDRPKPDMGDTIYNYYKSGHGSPRNINSDDDPESFWTEAEVEEDKMNFILTTDKRHGVRFTRGCMMQGVPVGYYIDIYEMVEVEDEKRPESFTNEQHNIIESIQNITLYCYSTMYADRDVSAAEVLETLRDWGEEFERQWSAHSEEYICSHSYEEDLYAFANRKMEVWLGDN